MKRAIIFLFLTCCVTDDSDCVSKCIDAPDITACYKQCEEEKKNKEDDYSNLLEPGEDSSGFDG